MLKEVRRGVLFTLTTMVLVGGVYHVLLWGIGRAVFPAQAEGSLLRRPDGRVVGSRLIAQKFERPEYFHPRPSAADYNAASAGGSNYGPSNEEHLKAVRARVDAVVARDGVSATQVPSEMVTASGAGMDPHIPPSGAEMQVTRVARSRGLDPGRVRDLVGAQTEPPTLRLLGRTRVNVLELNLALDQAFGTPAPAGATQGTAPR